MQFLQGRLFVLVEWFSRFIYLNLLWILFTAMGLIIFGIGPSTAGMFAVVRKWMMKEDDVNAFRIMWQTFKSEFWRGNSVGLIFIVLGYVLYVDGTLFYHSHLPFIHVMEAFVMALGVVYVVVLLYIFPSLAHYEVKFLSYFQIAFVTGFRQPFKTFLLISAIFFVIATIHGVGMLFSVSFISYAVMWIANRGFGSLTKTRIE